jgi:hypothetical protein
MIARDRTGTRPRQSHSQPDLSGWADVAEFGSPDVSAHRRQASVPGMAHDFLVRHAIAVCGRHKPGAQSVRADRLRRGTLHPGFRGASEENLADPIRAQPRGFDHAAAIDFAEQWTGGDFRLLQPGLQRRDRASLIGSTVWNGDFSAFTVRIRLGSFKQQRQAPRSHARHPAR